MTSAAKEDMKVTALVPWYGSNRMNAHRVGDLFRGCEWVGIPFAGGMCEVAHIKARTVLVNDLHRHVINLACCVGSPYAREQMVKALTDLPFHPDVLGYAQMHCIEMERAGWDFSRRDSSPDPQWATNYFISQWMGRSGEAGSDKEFKGGIPIRWNAGGGDSNVRYRSALQSLASWSEVMQRCTFSTLDFREFLGNCLKHDAPKHGIYSDAPFPAGGEKYKHKFTEKDHRDLRDLLVKFERAKVVVRYYDHALIRELYPVDRWEWIEFPGRKSSNAEAPEVLIVNRTGL